jgi:hypothetical protein
VREQVMQLHKQTLPLHPPRRFLTLFMPYDVYERHAMVGHLLQAAMRTPYATPCVLDVGGRSELLERFTPYRVTSANVDGSGDLVASGCAIPFADRSFDAVVSIDTLEHLPREARPSFLRECFRIARHYALIAAPFGSQGHIECERQLDRLCQSEYGEFHPYLHEHVTYGLPEVGDLDQFAADLKATSVRQLFAGDYVWQSKQFERAVLGHRRRGILARLWNKYNYVASLAIFHPIRVRDWPDATANRFYLLMGK